jgi:toxin ParE1/3/4
MSQLLISSQAENDLDDIWFFIAQDSPKNADKFLDLIQETCLIISDYPNMGEKRDEIISGVRSFPVGNYLLFYVALNHGVEIIRVMHGSRDLKALFQ